jgi:anti-anti-sigma factor
MEVIETEQDGVVIVEPRGRLDTGGAKPFGDRVTHLIGSGAHRLLIDLQHVRYVSSAGFRVFLVTAQHIKAAQGKLVLCGMSPELRRLFDIGNFTELFTITATREEGAAKAR